MPFHRLLHFFPLRAGWAVSCTLWFGLNTIFPPPGLGEVDDADVFDTFDDESTIHSVEADDKKAVGPTPELTSPSDGVALGYQRG